MDRTLVEAYTVIRDSAPDSGMEEWQIAQYILANWNVPKLGEDLAKRTLFNLINHIHYPSNELTTEIVGSAEDKIPELFPEIGEHDPDMHVVEWLEYKYQREKGQSDESKKALK